MKRYGDKDLWFEYDADMETPEDEVREQEQEVFHFRAVERFLPEERGFE